MRLLCAIHQPNFFPWLAYFDKIRCADVFVFLDDVLFNKSGSGMGCWTNRVRIDMQGQPGWFGCPVRREPGPQRIRNTRIDDRQPWRRKLLGSLEASYGRAPGFAPAMAVLRPLIEFPVDMLASLNEHAIKSIASVLGIEARFVRQSELDVAGTATELLIDIAKAVGADAYLAGAGSSGYQRDELFASRGIELIYQNFVPHPYGDRVRFLPGLSVIDYLMWGWPEPLHAA
jgi:WbqC-like protein family